MLDHNTFKLFDRQQTSLFASNTASVTGFNAFEQRGTIYRADMRADYKVADTDAFVYATMKILYQASSKSAKWTKANHGKT